MGVWVLPNANSLDVIARVRKEIDIIKTRAADGHAGRRSPSTRPKYINSAIHEVEQTLTETVLIVIVVIFLFLGSLRTVLVPLVAIPVSLIGAVFLMQVFGFTLNLLTLLAVVLSVGLVVDDAIVVVENVERHIREGKTPLAGRRSSARASSSGPIIAMTITLAAVYAPIGFQGGLTGALFREFAFTLAGAVFISGVVALTLSPMMSSQLLAAEHEPGLARRARIDGGFDARASAATRARSARRSRTRPAVYAVWIVLSLLVVPMYMFSPKELAPNEDQGVVFGAIDVPANATLEQLTPYTEQVNRIFESDARVRSQLPDHVPQRRLRRHAREALGRAQAEHLPDPGGAVAASSPAIAGIRAPVFLPSALPSAGFFPVEFVIASTASHEELLRFAQQLVQEAVKSGQFAFPPITDVRIDQAKSEIVLDRDKVASMGLTHAAGRRAISSSMLGGNFVNRFNIDGRSYKVIPQIERAGRLTPDAAERHPHQRARRAAHAAQRRRDASRRRRAAHAEPLPAAQRDQDLRRGPALARRRPQGARRRRGARSCRRATASTTRASRASSARRAASSCRRWGSRWCSSSWCSRRSSTRSAIRSSSSPARCRSRCSAR